jgi:filamin
VSVKRRGVLLPQAPFRIKVGAQEVGNADRVLVSGAGITQAISQQFNQIVLDTRKAGISSS